LSGHRFATFVFHNLYGGYVSKAALIDCNTHCAKNYCLLILGKT